MSETLSAEITQLQADVATLTAQAQINNAALSTFATDLAAAMAAAAAGGATPAQLQALTDLHTAITGATTSLAGAITANPLPAAPAAPAAPDVPPAAPAATF